MLNIIQRICWNSKDWRMPTGSTHEKGFPDQHGYGHEEWNFNLEDSLDGYIFPYTYSVPQEKNLKSSDGKFTIGFFTQHPASKRWMLVGFHHDAEIIDEDEYQKIISHFDENGVFSRRARELHTASSQFETEEQALIQVRDAFIKKWIRAKCRIDNVEYLESPFFIEKPSNHRFTKFTYVDSFPVPSKQFKVNSTPTALAEDGYLRETEKNFKEIIPRHNRLSNTFCKWLRSNKITPIQEQNFIDVLFSINKASFIAELKITYGTSTKKAIRESIGQLFEYNLYPGRELHDKWLIVLDALPSKKDKQYIDNINKVYNTKIALVWQTENKFVFYPDSAIDL